MKSRKKGSRKADKRRVVSWKCLRNMSGRRHAFSLLELLVVTAIITLLVTMTISAVGSLSRVLNLSAATQTLTDTLKLAQQAAMTKNRRIEVRFYKLSNSMDKIESSFRALQLFCIESQKTNSLKPITRIIYLPNPVVITEASPASTILDSKTGTNSWSIPEFGSAYDYASFRFLADGGTDLDVTKDWMATLVIPNDPTTTNNLPANFVTLRIDPVTGKVSVFRP